MFKGKCSLRLVIRPYEPTVLGRDENRMSRKCIYTYRTVFYRISSSTMYYVNMITFSCNASYNF